MRHHGDVMVLGWCGMRFRGELDMERLEVPDKFGDIWTITRDGQSVSRARCSAGRLRMSCMGTRRGVTKQRHGTELIGEGYYVYCGGFKVKKGSCSGGRRGGRMRILFGSQMMMGRGALRSKDL